MDIQDMKKFATLCSNYTDYARMLNVSLTDEGLKQTILGRMDAIHIQMLALEPQKDKSKLYLLTTIGDVEPELSGPFETKEDRLKAAVSHRQNDPDKKDGLFKLDVINGEPQVGTYCGDDLDD
jgi:hypothetical protein